MAFASCACICVDGLAKECQAFRVFDAQYPLGQVWYTCPYCGGKMRMATESERREWRVIQCEMDEARAMLRNLGKDGR